jgi:hypothetical protein
MAEPTVTDDIPQSVREAQEKFDAGMGADGDASPYPLLRELRAHAPVHPGWPEIGIVANAGSRSAARLARGLLTHTDQLTAVLADHSLLPQAIEEGIRWETSLLNFMREARCDTELGGVQIGAGAMMAVNIGRANHDETRWEHPERFNIFREHKPHIGFAGMYFRSPPRRNVIWD